MRKQGGFTLMTLIFLLALASFFALIGFKVAPAYMKYFAVKNSLQNILKEDGGRTNEELRRTFAARMDVNYVQDIEPSDLEISRDDGMLTLSVPINSKEHIAGGVSVAIDLVAEVSEPLK
ncbi:MAG: DUF4845 domain-containing protein [Pseudomonadota bacterium]